MNEIGKMPRRVAIVALLIVVAVASDFDYQCHENCSSCNGPDEYECTACEIGFCMEDEQYRINFYGGEGRCWNIDCTEGDDSAGSMATVGVLYRAILAATMIIWWALE